MWVRNRPELITWEFGATGLGPTLQAIEITTGPTLGWSTPVQLFPVGFSQVIGGGRRRNYDVTGDGERFVVTLPPSANSGADEPLRINIVQNWFEELMRLVPTN